MVKATCKGQVVAESDDTVVVEGNHYFPPDSLNRDYFADSATQTVCPWKGTAAYYSVTVDGQTNTDAAWFYPEPKEAASQIAGHVAFWRGVTGEA